MNTSSPFRTLVKNSLFAALLLPALVILTPQLGLGASVDTFNNGTGNDLWNAAGNWSLAIPTNSYIPTFNGSNTVYLGTVADSASSLSFTSGTTTFTSGTPGSTANLTLTAGIALTGTSTSATIGDSTNADPVNVIVSGNQTFSAATGDTLVVGNGTANTITGGSTASTLTLSGAGSVTVGNLQNGTGGIAAPLSLTTSYSTSSVFTITGTNTATGAFNVNSGGTDVLTGSTIFSTYTAGGGSLNITANGTIASGTILGGNGTFSDTSNTNASGAISGNASIALTGGTLTATVADTFTGATSESGGTISISSNGKFSNTSGVTLTGGTFNDGLSTDTTGVTNRINPTVNLTIGGATPTFNFNRPAASTASQSLNSLILTPGSSTITTAGATLGTAALNFTSSTPYTRPLGAFINLNPATNAAISFTTAPSGSGNVASGVLVGAALNGNNFILDQAGAASSVTYVAGTNPQWSSTGFNTFTSSATINANSTTEGLSISGGSTTLTLSGTNTISSGGIIVGSGANSATLTGGSLQTGVSGGDLWVYTNGKPVTINSTIVDNGGSSLSLGGTSTYSIGGVDTYTGATNFDSSNTITIASGGDIALSSGVTVGVGTLSIASGGAIGTSTTSVPLTVATGATVTNSGTIYGNVTDNPSTSTTTVNLTNNGTITGNLTIAPATSGIPPAVSGDSSLIGYTTLTGGSSTSVGGNIIVNGNLTISGTTPVTLGTIASSYGTTNGLGAIFNNSTSTSPVTFNMTGGDSFFRFAPGAGSNSILNASGASPVYIFSLGQTGNIAYNVTFNSGTFDVSQVGQNNTGGQNGGTFNIINGSTVNLDALVFLGNTAQGGSFMHGTYNVGGASAGTLNISNGLNENNGSGAAPSTGATNGLDITVGNLGTVTVAGFTTLGMSSAQTSLTNLSSDYINILSGGTFTSTVSTDNISLGYNASSSSGAYYAYSTAINVSSGGTLTLTNGSIQVGAITSAGTTITGTQTQSNTFTSAGTVVLGTTSGSFTLGSNSTNSNQPAPGTANIQVVNTLALTGGKLVIPGTLSATTGTGLAQQNIFNWTGGQLTAGTITTSATYFNGAGSTVGGINTSLPGAGATLVNGAGTLAPGDIGTAGKTTITGNYLQTSGGAINIDLNGTTQASAFQNANAYDFVSISGNGTLGGTLTINLGGTYTPAVGNNFTILSTQKAASSLGGTFTSSNWETGHVDANGFNQYYYVASSDGASGLYTKYTLGSSTVNGSVALVYASQAGLNYYTAASGNNWDASSAGSWSLFDPGSGAGATGTATGAVAIFGNGTSGSTGTGTNSVILNSNRDIGGIDFTSTSAGPAYSIGTSNSSVLTLDNTKFGPSAYISDTSAYSNTISVPITVNGALAVTTASNQTLTVSGNITPLTTANTLTVAGPTSGTGTLLLTGTDSFSATNIGTSIAPNATLQLGNGGTTGSLGSSTVNIYGPASNFVVDESGTVTQGTAFGTITGNGNFSQSGTGTTILNAANTYGGNSNLNSGIVQVAVNNTGTSGAFGNPGSGYSINFNGGTLQYATGYNADYSSQFSSSQVQQYNIDVNGNSVTYANTLSGLSGSSLTLQDSTATATTSSGILTLSAGPSYNGATTVNSGTLNVTGGDLSNSSAVTVGNGSKAASVILASTSNGGVGSGSGAVTVNSGGSLLLQSSSGGTINSTTTTVNSGGSLLFGTAGGTINASSGSGISLAGKLGFSNRSASTSVASVTASAPLTLQTGSSAVLDFGAGGSLGAGNTNTLTFTSLQNLASATALSIYDYVASTAGYSTGATMDNGGASDKLLFSSNPGLTGVSTQITFYSDSGLTAIGNGEEVMFGGQYEIVPVSGAAVPEPSTVFAGVCFLALLVYSNRRRIMEQLQLANL